MKKLILLLAATVVSQGIFAWTPIRGLPSTCKKCIVEYREVCHGPSEEVGWTYYIDGNDITNLRHNGVPVRRSAYSRYVPATGECWEVKFKVAYDMGGYIWSGSSSETYQKEGVESLVRSCDSDRQNYMKAEICSRVEK